MKREDGPLIIELDSLNYETGASLQPHIGKTIVVRAGRIEPFERGVRLRWVVLVEVK